eukprot:TRINITY_DN6833_c0_g1_i1.p1 TRINITY_DN6833_c0_g1~~TRINITY_DN6833_c0_g1_i1.p1  ORF type:complete len:154 (-),score=32.58 TRINITY_DN6833_c0_g1_i1:100-561(-)
MNEGYQFIYLTARPFSSHEATQKYLDKITQNDFKMPNGPILMSPESMIDSFKTEVIHKKSEYLKIAWLADIKKLFPSEINPIKAGFGNRENDLLAYKLNGIPPERIFYINENSYITSFQSKENGQMELKKIYKTYQEIIGYVKQIFGIKEEQN